MVRYCNCGTVQEGRTGERNEDWWSSFYLRGSKRSVTRKIRTTIWEIRSDGNRISSSSFFLSKILVKNLRESFVGQIFNPLNDDRTLDWDKSFRISGNQTLRVLLRLIKILIFIFIVLGNFSLVLFVEQC